MKTLRRILVALGIGLLVSGGALADTPAAPTGTEPPALILDALTHLSRALVAKLAQGTAEPGPFRADVAHFRQYLSLAETADAQLPVAARAPEARVRAAEGMASLLESTAGCDGERHLACPPDLLAHLARLQERLDAHLVATPPSQR